MELSVCSHSLFCFPHTLTWTHLHPSELWQDYQTQASVQLDSLLSHASKHHGGDCKFCFHVTVSPGHNLSRIFKTARHKNPREDIRLEVANPSLFFLAATVVWQLNESMFCWAFARPFLCNWERVWLDSDGLMVLLKIKKKKLSLELRFFFSAVLRE